MSQLDHIKGHYHWLVYLTGAWIIVLAVLTWGVFEIIEFKRNYTRLWRDKAALEREVRIIKTIINSKE